MTAIIKAAGTSPPAHLSTIRCMGALFSSASFTILISFWSEESSPTLVAIISIEPSQFKVPQNTSSSMALSIGNDSPVIIDWSTDEFPKIIFPSTGIVSPGSTLRISSLHISSIGTMFSIIFLFSFICY